jgi:hypothetical protein
LATLGKRIPFLEGATLKELRQRLLTAKPRNPFQGCEEFLGAFLNPGFQSKPWADIGQRFQRYSILARTHEFSTFCAKPSFIPLLPTGLKPRS